MTTVNYTLDSTRKLGAVFNTMLSDIKMMHWYTQNYNLHLIFADLYDALSDLVDKLQEEIIGTSRQTGISFPDCNLDEFLKFDINNFKDDESIIFCFNALQSTFKEILESAEFISYTKSVTSGLLNTKDEIISILNKTNYLISMTK